MMMKMKIRILASYCNITENHREKKATMKSRGAILLMKFNFLLYELEQEVVIDFEKHSRPNVRFLTWNTWHRCNTFTFA